MVGTSLSESDPYGRSSTEKALPDVCSWDDHDEDRSSLDDMDVTREQMRAWDRMEQEMQDEEAFRYTCPCCTNRRLEQNPRIETNNDTLGTRTYPVQLREDEDPSDVFDRDGYVPDIDDSGMYEDSGDGSPDEYFRRSVFCGEHEDTTYLEYVGQGEGSIEDYGLKAILTA